MSVPTSWADFGAIATIAQTFIILTAALYARNQFREADRNRRLLATTELFRIIGEEEFRLLRDWAMNDLPGVDATKSPSDLAKARKVAVKYDRLAYMVHQDLLPRKALLDFQADELMNLWIKLEPAVMYVRKSQSRPSYCCNFEQLVMECNRMNKKASKKKVDVDEDCGLPTDAS